MIKFATQETIPEIRKMWQSVFQDEDQYLDLYFARNIIAENSLIYYDNDIPAASLNMVQYNFSFYNQLMPCYYLTALATYPEFRRKGYMDALITEALSIMRSRKIPLSILIPGEEWLYNFYANYGYVQTFEKDEIPIDLRKIIEKSKSLEDAYIQFDNIYNKESFTVLKDIAQFTDIVAEQKMYNGSKTNVDGTSRIIDVLGLLRIYAKNNPTKKFTVKISGDKQLLENNGYYTIEEGVVSKFTVANADLEVNIKDIAQLLLGFENDNLPTKYYYYFPKHKTSLNLMLD